MKMVRELRPTPAERKLNSDLEQIDGAVATSPTFLKLADSILLGVDRRTAGELVAGYLYFRATGRTDADFTRFLLANRLDLVLRMIGNSLPVLIPALFSDKELRSFFANVLLNWFASFESKK